MDKRDKSKDDLKRRVESAINSYHERHWNEIQKEQGLIKKRKNKKPEKIVEEDCMWWMRSQGWIMEVYESKATWNPKASCYMQQSMKAGTTDSMGNMPDGLSVAIEFKALGKLSTFNRPGNHRQQEFLKNKIKSGCFGCVVDSVDRLKLIYSKWQMLSLKEEKVKYLLEQLP